jgi:hypothetical protein
MRHKIGLHINNSNLKDHNTANNIFLGDGKINLEFNTSYIYGTIESEGNGSVLVGGAFP